MKKIFIFLTLCHSYSLSSLTQTPLFSQLSEENPCFPFCTRPYTSHPQYRKLLFLLTYYQKSMDKDQWVTACSFQEGDPGFQALAQRLVQLRYLKDQHKNSVPLVIKSLILFQRSHGISCEASLTPKTLTLLNRPIKERIDSIYRNISRWKNIGFFQENHLLVNIPHFTLYAFNKRRPYFCTAVMVGKKETPTPVFNGFITEVVTHPSWYIPAKLVRTLQLNVGYKGYRWEKGRLIQGPGPSNALGSIKFVVTGSNENIILHSTPHLHLFNKTERAESMGCIRVKDFIPLSKIITKNNEEEFPIEKCIKNKKTRSFLLTNSFPIHVIYSTIWIDNNDIPFFFYDIYGYDKN